VAAILGGDSCRDEYLVAAIYGGGYFLRQFLEAAILGGDGSQWRRLFLDDRRLVF